MKYSILNKAIGANIAFVRKSNNMTQREVSEKIGVTRGHYSCIEIGRTEIGLENLYSICSLFKCKIMDILPGIIRE